MCGKPGPIVCKIDPRKHSFRIGALAKDAKNDHNFKTDICRLWLDKADLGDLETQVSSKAQDALHGKCSIGQVCRKFFLCKSWFFAPGVLLLSGADGLTGKSSSSCDEDTYKACLTVASTIGDTCTKMHTSAFQTTAVATMSFRSTCQKQSRRFLLRSSFLSFQARAT